MSLQLINEFAVTEEVRRTKVFEAGIAGNEREMVGFITNILESSTEYSIIGKDLNGTILLSNSENLVPKMAGFKVWMKIKSKTPG